jgi:hypothetical protein
MSFQVVGNRQTQHIEVKVQPRKCSHLYFYFDHPTFGFMHLRLQTWFPFRVDVCVNGRHWLGKQLDQAGVAYQKKENRNAASLSRKPAAAIALSIPGLRRTEACWSWSTKGNLR